MRNHRNFGLEFKRQGRTIAIAQSLGIPEDQIEKWADARRKHTERVNIVDSLLDKLE